MARSLQILAGKRAFQHLKEHGLRAQDVKMILGASGGPKWFVLSRLDQYLNSKFLSQANQPIQLVGSSIGAWRMACYAESDPKSAILRLEQSYLHQRYPRKASGAVVSANAQTMLEEFLPDSEIDFVLENSNRHLNIVTARCHGWLEQEYKPKQLTGFMGSAVANAVSRKMLNRFFERVVFSQHMSDSPYRTLDGIPGRLSSLNQQNLKSALLASVSIPVVLEGVQDISGAPNGTYRDGGLLDYHFDLPFRVENGIILYPHFAPLLKPGWFDKSLRWRGVNARNYEDVVLLAPTAEFIQHLPYGKIPDRGDFKKIPDNVREQYWKDAIKQGQRLADDLHELLHSDRLVVEMKELIPSRLRSLKR
ncbi:patatin-like phospholipase family protein [Gynuella sp.]|uniref:patatin-like phospholipase family protein n=1 Tax=Gynuella sp. TaxID=2969146 RepID=UPI003D0C159C